MSFAEPLRKKFVLDDWKMSLKFYLSPLSEPNSLIWDNNTPIKEPITQERRVYAAHFCVWKETGKGVWFHIYPSKQVEFLYSSDKATEEGKEVMKILNQLHYTIKE